MKNGFMKAIAVLVAVALLVVTPAGNILDIREMHQVEAAEVAAPIVAGVLLAVAALSFNVYIAANQQEAAVSDFLSYAESSDDVESPMEEYIGIFSGSSIKRAYTIDKLLLDIVKSWLVDRGADVTTATPVSLSSVGTLSFNDLLCLSDAGKANLSNLNSSLVGSINDYLSDFTGFYTVSDRVVSFWPVDISSFDGCYDSSGLYFYNYGNIAESRSLYSIACESGGAYLLKAPMKFSYNSSYTSFTMTVLDDYIDNDSALQDFSYSSLGTIHQHHLQYYVTSSSGFYFGTPFNYSDTKSAAVKGSYTSWRGFSDSNVDIATSYGAYDIANTGTLSNAVVTQEALDAAYGSFIQAMPQQDSNDLTDEQRAALVAALVAQALAQAGIDGSQNSEEPEPDDGNDVVLPVVPPLDIPSYSEDTEVSAGDQATIEQSVVNTNSILEGLNNIISVISNLPDLIGDVFSRPLAGIKNAITSVAQSVWDFFEGPLLDIKNAVTSIPETILDGFASLLDYLFVPDTSYVEGQIGDIVNRYDFLFSVVATVDDMKSRFSGTEPPKIYIHFEESEDERFSSIGTLLAVDFSWYERYKPYGDIVLSSILWAFFVWRFYKALPNILNGTGLAADRIDDINQVGGRVGW